MNFKDVLRGHAFISEAQKAEIWNVAHFCFDTNVLLDVYRYGDDGRKEFLKLLTAIKGRIFIPHRVAEEFARNRITVIQEQYAPLRQILKKFDDAQKDIQQLHRRHPKKGAMLEALAKAKTEIEANFGGDETFHRKLISDDLVLSALLSAIGETVGDPYPVIDLDTEYDRRKAGNIPPFCKHDENDKDEFGRKGDVCIWLELMKKYKGTKTPLIFITDDQKDNWWGKLDGGRRYPQPPLVREMFDQSEAEILFYSSERFSEVAPGYLKITVPTSFAQETKDIREQKIEHRNVAMHTWMQSLFGASNFVSKQQFPTNQQLKRMKRAAERARAVSALGLAFGLSPEQARTLIRNWKGKARISETKLASIVNELRLGNAETPDFVSAVEAELAVFGINVSDFRL